MSCLLFVSPFKMTSNMTLTLSGDYNLLHNVGSILASVILGKDGTQKTHKENDSELHPLTATRKKNEHKYDQTVGNKQTNAINCGRFSIMVPK